MLTSLVFHINKIVHELFLLKLTKNVLQVFEKVGQVSCTDLDVAVTMGRCETVVESFYLLWAPCRREEPCPTRYWKLGV
jgi:hypothetical protein